MLRDRSEAGQRLADKLIDLETSSTAVIALPRGGVVVGYQIAKKLALSLDILPVRKVGHSLNPEYAVCAVDDSGSSLCNEAEVKNIDPRWLGEEIERGRKEAARRALLYRQGRKPIKIKNKNVILADDGVATGLSIRLAIQSLKKSGAKKVIVAVPVIPKETAAVLRKETDELVALEIPEFFLGAVGAYYQNFDQVSDEEVIKLLKK